MSLRHFTEGGRWGRRINRFHVSAVDHLGIVVLISTSLEQSVVSSLKQSHLAKFCQPHENGAGADLAFTLVLVVALLILVEVDLTSGLRYKYLQGEQQINT